MICFDMNHANIAQETATRTVFVSGLTTALRQTCSWGRIFALLKFGRCNAVQVSRDSEPRAAVHALALGEQ